MNLYPRLPLPLTPTVNMSLFYPSLPHVLLTSPCFLLISMALSADDTFGATPDGGEVRKKGGREREVLRLLTTAILTVVYLNKNFTMQ